MWIQTKHTATEELYVAEIMDEPVEFSANGTAQVKQDVGEALIQTYDGITEHDK